MEDLKHSETWRVFRFSQNWWKVWDPECIGHAVAVFGSSRIFQVHTIMSRQLNFEETLQCGFAVITGASRNYGSVNKERNRGKANQSGLNIEIPAEQIPNKYQDISLSFNISSSENSMFVKYATAFIIFPADSAPWWAFWSAHPLPDKKIGVFPINTFREKTTGSLIDWFQSTLIPDKTISPEIWGWFHLLTVCMKSARYWKSIKRVYTVDMPECNQE